MNILYLCNEYTDDLIGGIGSVVKTEASAMVKLGHKAFVAGSYLNTPNPPVAWELDNGITVFRWNDGDHHTFHLSVLKTLSEKFTTWKLKRLVNQLEKVRAKHLFNRTVQLVNDLARREHIDLIEMPDYYDEFYRHQFIVPQKPFVVPVVIRVHGSVSFIQHYSNGNVSPRVLAADRSLFAIADGISAVSEFSKRFVQKYLCSPNQKVDVIYNPIEDRLFEGTVNTPPPPSRGDERGRVTTTILFIGKINEAKGVYSIIKAFNKLSERYPDMQLRLIGEGDIPYAQSLVASHCVDRVFFTGYLHRHKLLEEIDKSSFCVLPSYFENFSMAALEVLARKRALIYTDRASGAELIEEGVDGMLVDPDDTDQMVEKMSMLVEDEGFRDRLAENGYTMCRRRFSTEAIIPQIEKYYKKLCAKQCTRK